MPKLAYSPKFMQEAKRNGLFAKFRKSNKGFYDTSQGIIVERRDRGKSHLSKADLWRVVDGKTEYFVKKATISRGTLITGQTGYEQFVVLQELKRFSTRHVKPAEPLLGYTGSKQSYLVLPNLYGTKIYGTSISVPNAVHFEFYEFRENAEKIGAVDLLENYIYDPVKKLITVFDPLVREYSKLFYKLGLDKV